VTAQVTGVLKKSLGKMRFVTTSRAFTPVEPCTGPMNAEIGLQPESRIRIDVRLPGFDLLRPSDFGMEVSGGVPSAAGPRTNALLKFELASPGLKPDCERACFWALGAAVSASRLHKDWAWWTHIPLLWTHRDKTS